MSKGPLVAGGHKHEDSKQNKSDDNRIRREFNPLPVLAIGWVPSDRDVTGNGPRVEYIAECKMGNGKVIAAKTGH